MNLKETEAKWFGLADRLVRAYEASVSGPMKSIPITTGVDVADGKDKTVVHDGEGKSIHDTDANIGRKPPEEEEIKFDTSMYTKEVMATWNRKTILDQAKKFGIVHKPQVRDNTLLEMILKRVKGLESKKGVKVPEPGAGETDPIENGEGIENGETGDIGNLFGEDSSTPPEPMTKEEITNLLHTAIKAHGAHVIGPVMAKVHGKTCVLANIDPSKYNELAKAIEEV